MTNGSSGDLELVIDFFGGYSTMEFHVGYHKTTCFFFPVDRGVHLLRIFGEVQTQVSTRGHLWRIGKTFPFRDIT